MDKKKRDATRLVRQDGDESPRRRPIMTYALSMKAQRFNWPIWAGFLLSLIAFLSYFLIFVWFPVTRDFPWANLLLFALAAALLLIGVRRAFAPDQPHPTRSKIAGSILATLSVAI